MGAARGRPPVITLRREEGLRPFLNDPDASLNATCALASRTARRILRASAHLCSFNCSLISRNPPVVAGLEHAICVVGADEGVGTVPSPARVLKLHEHPFPNVVALVVYLGQTVRRAHLTTEEAIDLAVGATAHASSLILLIVLPGPLLKLGLLGGDRDKFRVDGAHVPGGTRCLLPTLIVTQVTHGSLPPLTLQPPYQLGPGPTRVVGVG